MKRKAAVPVIVKDLLLKEMQKADAFCSKRAKALVQLCENAPSPTLSEASAISSCFTMSPLPSWWDSVFEASDVAVAMAINNFPAGSDKLLHSVKKKLFLSPSKGVRILPSAVPNVCRNNPVVIQDQAIDDEKKVKQVHCSSPAAGNIQISLHQQDEAFPSAIHNVVSRDNSLRSQDQAIYEEKKVKQLHCSSPAAGNIQSSVNQQDEAFPSAIHNVVSRDNSLRSQDQAISDKKKVKQLHCSSPAAGNIQSSVNQQDEAFPSAIHNVVSGDNSLRSQDQSIDKKKVNSFQLYPSQKKIITAKLALNAGKEHMTREGKLKKCRTLKPSCKENCKRCAKPKLTLSEREQINSEFWALMDHVKQWSFINKSVSCTRPKTKTCVPGAKGEKLFSRVYKFDVSNTSKIVCKTMFKSTLSICDSWIDSALVHFVNGEMTSDKRGRALCVKSNLKSLC